MLGKWRLMRNMQKFAVFALALPLCLAMPSVAFADTVLTSKTYVDTNMVAYDQGTGDNDARVGKTLVVNSSGQLELGVTGNVFYGTSSTAAGTTPKEVTVSGITKLIPGTIVVVTPADNKTSTAGASNLKVNNFTPYPMKYMGAALTSTTCSNVWVANIPSIWMFDGSAWNFIGQGKYDTGDTYSAFTGPNVSNNTPGTTGLVPAPAVAAADKYLKGDGTWDNIKVPVTASGAPSSNTVTGIAEIWIQ